jgi:hypothetical protein
MIGDKHQIIQIIRVLRIILSTIHKRRLLPPGSSGLSNGSTAATRLTVIVRTEQHALETGCGVSSPGYSLEAVDVEQVDVDGRFVLCNEIR